MTVRRLKSYSAATGFVYQYYFEEVRAGARRDSREGSEYLYIVSRDRKRSFPVPVFFRQDARDAWARAHGRPLSGTETYAAAKMRLLAAFDDAEDLERDRLTVEVTAENIDELLAALDIG